MSVFQASAQLMHVPAFCNWWGLDLTVGCQHACAYCYFERNQAVTARRAHGGRELRPTLSIEEFLRRPDYPPEIYLSPFTDPLAPAAVDNLEQVLDRVLPLSVRVILSTKGIVPRRIWRRLTGRPEQIRLVVGLTSLDDDRNAAVEPGCPPARARLANFRLAREYGVDKVTARIDPILPGVDDAPDQLTHLLDRLSGIGVQAVTASYLFVGPTTRKRMRRTPYLGEAASLCTELSPVQASPTGTCGEIHGVYSVPLERKRALYEWLHTACAARGLVFGTCGCKDLRLTGPFTTACTVPDRTACEAPAVRNRDRSLPVCD